MKLTSIVDLCQRYNVNAKKARRILRTHGIQPANGRYHFTPQQVRKVKSLLGA